MQIVKRSRLLDGIVFTVFVLFVAGFGLFLCGELHKMHIEPQNTKLGLAAAILNKMFPFPDKKYEFNLTHVILFALLIGVLSMEHHIAQDTIEQDKIKRNKKQAKRDSAKETDKKEKRNAALIFLVYAGYLQATNATSSCPCFIEGGKLSCHENTINTFPADLTALGCDDELDYSSAWGLVIENQPIRTLNSDAFRSFPLLMQIAMSFNEIEIVNSHAFRGLKEVRTLFLKDNNLHTIAEGALDDLVSLQTLDLRNNPLLESYTTNAWHFCTSTAEFDLDEDSPTFFKNFATSEMSDEYCTNKLDFPIDGCFRSDDGTIDCTSIQDFTSTSCNIQNENFTNIIFTYPTDVDAKIVENYFEGESNAFFQEFNSQKGSMEHAKFMKELTLYETKYDLTKMKEVTSERTEVVTIKADTVYMSSPVTINHHLNIQARVVALDFPISMNMTKQLFANNPTVEAWAHKEEYYYVGKVLMNRKSFGLVTVLQSAANVPAMDRTEVCHPQVSWVEDKQMDVSEWYDPTTINLHYVCAMTVMKTLKNANLVEDISHYILNFVYNTSTVGKQSTFIAAQKFNRILELNQLSTVHNVPTYSVETVSSLANLMHDRMTNYKANELQQETQLSLATGRATDMQISFETVKMQQQQYFSTELAILDSIWAAVDNQWDFDFAHRNGIEDQISSSMDAIQDQIFAMQEQELKAALDEATLSQQHIDDVIESYENQIGRLNDLVKASVDVQSQLMERLKKNTNNMDHEFNNFQHAIEEWKHKQEVKAVFAIFKAVFSFGIGIATGNPEDLDIGEVIGDIMEIFDLLMELVEIIESCQDIQDMINDLDLENLADINLSLGTSFKNSLQTMVKLKLKGSDFDELDRTATVKIGIMNQATNFEIDGVDDCMMACLSVSDVGHQMINEAADFADVILRLSEENDKLFVAKEDRERTTKQIEDISKQIEDLKAMKEQFMADREQAKKDYEDQLEEMKANYQDISDELRAEYKEKIMASFKTFETSFNSLSKSYDRQIFLVISTIHQKFYGLKEHSMNQRAMILSLYLDFCDAEYYNSFKTCEEQNLPYMSDDIDTLLSKLIDIQWESVISNEEIPGTPIEFDGSFVIQSEPDILYGGKKNFLVDTLRNTSEVGINLRDLDINNRFDDFWRIRIETIKITLLDENASPIQSAGTDFGEEIQIKIRYPTLFNDTDNYKNSNSFLAQNFACNSDYVTFGTDILWKSECKVDQPFSQKNYKPSADGVFTFKIENPNTIDMESLNQIMIDFTGTRIRFNVKGKPELPLYILD